MSKKVPVYLSEEELLILNEGLSGDLYKLSEKSELREKLKERLQAELETFEE